MNKSFNASTLSEVLAELSTLGDFLRWGYTQLQQAELHYGHGTDNAWDEVVYLILSTLNLGPHLNQNWINARLTTSEKKQIIDRLSRRIDDKIPTAYLVNQAWFAGLSFYVDERVLIPRSPIAELIEQQFTPWIEEERVHNILDLGTGSGCIAIACAYAFLHAHIDAVDCSTEALAVAHQNVLKHHVENSVSLILSKGFEKLEGQLYDIIISNPPYVNHMDIDMLPDEYRHEPELALAAGEDGLDVIKQILQEAPAHLNEEGILVVEVGNSKQALLERFPHLPFIWLDFERGEAEVFLLTREQLLNVKKI